MYLRCFAGLKSCLTFWADEPADAYGAGGLGVRDLKVVSAHLGVDESCTAFIAELAYLASLVSIDGDERILPSSKFDIC